MKICVAFVLVYIVLTAESRHRKSNRVRSLNKLELLWEITEIHFLVKNVEIFMTGPETIYAFSAFYDHCTESVYYVDLGAPTCDSSSHCLFRYDYIKNETKSAYIDSVELFSKGTSLIPVEKGVCNPTGVNYFVASFGQRLILLRWDLSSDSATVVKSLIDEYPDYPDSFMAAANVDDHGRYVTSSISSDICKAPAWSSVYAYNSRRRALQTLITGTASCPGIGFYKGATYHLDACLLILTKIITDRHGKMSTTILSPLAYT